MSDRDEKLREQMAQIGTRYLGRTLGELRKLRELAEQLAAGTPGTLLEIEHLAHKIHGSGAMFGFDTISETAGEVEHIAAYLDRGHNAERMQGSSEAELTARLQAGVVRLNEHTRAAAQGRGLDPDAF